MFSRNLKRPVVTGRSSPGLLAIAAPASNPGSRTADKNELSIETLELRKASPSRPRGIDVWETVG